MASTSWRYAAPALLSAGLLAACGPAGPITLAPPASSKVIRSAPEWFVEPRAQAGDLVAAATMTSRDMQTAVTKARTLAQADLAQQLGTRMSSLTRQFQEETGAAVHSEFLTRFSQAVKAVSDQTLRGARVEAQELLPEGRVYRAYVLMSLDLAASNRLLAEKLRADEPLYTRARATQAFADLEREVEGLSQRLAPAPSR